MGKNQALAVTPLQATDSFLLKREDFNPSGSVKDRAVVKQLRWARAQGYQQVAISTSGNAGVSVAYWAPFFSLQATVFVSPKINPQKLKRLEKMNCRIEVTPRPISSCWKFCQQNKVWNLRQSKDPRALQGFALLGKELSRQIKRLKEKPVAIFFPVSSGATLRGVMQELSLAPFVVQPASHPLLARRWDKKFTVEKEHLTDALVAKIIPYQEEIIELVERKGGGGVVVQNEAIRRWQKWLIGQGIKTSPEGALTLAGAEKAYRQKLIPAGAKVICLLTGKAYQDD